MNEEHSFDRRITDANMAALNIRVTGLEGRMEIVEQKQDDHARELFANTALTKQVHSNTEEIVAAVTWLSTSKKVIVAGVATVGGIAAAGSAIVAFFKLL